MKINCDIGERGIDNLTDLALMKLIDIANIACGGHAGDASARLAAASTKSVPIQCSVMRSAAVILTARALLVAAALKAFALRVSFAKATRHLVITATGTANA